MKIKINGKLSYWLYCYVQIGDYLDYNTVISTWSIKGNIISYTYIQLVERPAALSAKFIFLKFRDRGRLYQARLA
jgi:hypothetical protein